MNFLEIDEMYKTSKLDKLTNKFYGECSDYYELLYPDHLNYSEIFFNDINPLLKQRNVKNILDVSCGAGHDMVLLLDKGYNVDGCDICEKMLSTTERNLLTKGYKNFNLYNFDVRNLGDELKNNLYDAVIFRGNTFSNIPHDDIPVVIKQLKDLITKNGIIILDYRSGNEQFKTQTPFEFRGSGYLSETETLFMSFYNYEHSLRMDEPYNVIAFIWLWQNFAPNPTLKTFSINSFYVDEQIIFNSIRENHLEHKEIKVKANGLPFLKSLILNKV